MEKDTIKKNENAEIINKDRDGKVIPAAFPVSARTKKDQSKTSVIYTLIAVLLHIIAFVPVVAIPIVLAVKCYQLAPYYSFWHFVGLIVSIVFAIIYTVVVFCVTRKKSKSNIAMQTVKVAITFACLTSVFALILTYALPDIIGMATQSTLFAEDVYYNGEAQAEKNLRLDRDFIMYNLLNGNLNDYSVSDNGDFSYATLSKHTKDSFGKHQVYDNAIIEETYNEYLSYSDVSLLQSQVIDVMKAQQPRKYELYEFIYQSYVLNDFDYALYNNINRRAFALALVDYEYTYGDYENLLKEGFNNKKLKQLFDTNFDNFNQDGYQTFDDPLLLYAQMTGRMTVPVVLRLILNDGWTYTQGAFDESGNLQYSEDGNFLYEIYDPEARDKFVAANGEFKFTGKLLNVDGSEYEVKYGFNEDGWMVYENGVVKRPIKWLVLDMLGDPMDIATVDVFSMLSGLVGGMDLSKIVSDLLPMLGNLIDSVGNLLQEDVAELVKFATGGANLNINICFNDDNELSIGISGMNSQYAMIGYMQASWVQSNNLLMAVINLLGIRNWLSIFGAVGVVLVVAAGVLRECARKTRLRTAVSRDRIQRANTAQRIADGEYDPSEFNEHSVLSENLTPEDIAAIENAQKNKKPLSAKADKGKKSIEDIDLDNLDDINLDDIDLADIEGLDLDEELTDTKSKKKKADKKKDKKKAIDEIALDDLDIDNIDLDKIDLDKIDLDNIEDIDTIDIGEKSKAPEVEKDNSEVAEKSETPEKTEKEKKPEKEKKEKASKKKDKKKSDDLDDIDIDDIDLDNLEDLDIGGIDLGDDDLLDAKSKKKK